MAFPSDKAQFCSTPSAQDRAALARPYAHELDQRGQVYGINADFWKARQSLAFETEPDL